MNDRENDFRNELSFTFGSIKDRLNGLTSKIQSGIQDQIKKNNTEIQSNNDYLSNIRNTVETNMKMSKGEIPIPETPKKPNSEQPTSKVSDVPFIGNHLTENPEAAKTVKEATQNQTAKKTEPEGPPPKLLDKKKVRGLNVSLKQRVFGQDETVSEVVDILKVAALDIKINAKKPAGCYFFAGPSGVGKTELAQAIADQLEVPLLKLNMGEYGLEHEVSKLIGAPPGYAGCDQDGALTGFVKEKKACVVLLDEIEKAHFSIDKILLSIMDHGECGTNKGDSVSFTETIIISTSNLGAEVEYIDSENFLSNKKALEDFAGKYNAKRSVPAETDEINRLFVKSQRNELRMEYIKEGLRPEIINRYDSIFQLNALTKEIYAKVVNKFLNQLTKSIKDKHGFDLKYSEKIVSWIVDKSYDPAMGGRPARKFVEKIVIKPLADYMLDDNFENTVKEQKEISMDLNKNDNVCFKGKKNKILGVLENTNEILAKFETTKFSKSPKP